MLIVTARPASFRGVIWLKLRVQINEGIHSTSKSLLCLLRVSEVITNGNNKAIAAGGAWHCFLWCRPLAVVGPIQYFTLHRIARCAVIRKRHLGALCVITLEGANRAVAGKRPYWVGSTCWQQERSLISWTLFWLPNNLSHSWGCCWRAFCCFKDQERCWSKKSHRVAADEACWIWNPQQTTEWNSRLIFWGRDIVLWLFLSNSCFWGKQCQRCSCCCCCSCLSSLQRPSCSDGSCLVIRTPGSLLSS